MDDIIGRSYAKAPLYIIVQCYENITIAYGKISENIIVLHLPNEELLMK